jgi:phage shock protein E
MSAHPIRSWSRPMAAAALAAAAITGVSACSSGAPASSPTTTASGARTTATGQHMAASDFSTAMKTPGTVVIDVRTPAEFAAGHLPNAHNIDLNGSDFATRIAALDKKATYAVYCKSGKRSAAAMAQMTAASFTHVYDMAGGIGAWQEMGGAMMKGGSMPSGGSMMTSGH